MKYTQAYLLVLLFILFIGSNADGQVKPIADGQSKFLGCAWSSKQSTDFTELWNQVTPENGGKWGSVEGTRNVMGWTEMDASYNLAKNNGIPFKQPGSVGWGAPDAATEDDLDPDCCTSDEWPEADERTLERLRENFPRLLRAFEEAVERGSPLPRTF
jgi:endo-1,4-beta-xylanase